MNEDDLINAPKIVGVYKLKNFRLDDAALIKKTYLPVEFIHWIGMGGEFAYVVEDILKKHPEYADFLTTFNENGAIVAAAHDNVEALKHINTYAPHSLNYKNQKVTLLTVALEERSEKCLKFLLGQENFNWKVLNIHGQSVTHLCCAYGNSDLLEELDELGLTDWHLKENLYGRIPLYFIVDSYLAHKNNLLFEFALEKYKKSQLFEADDSGMNILEFVYSKMKHQPLVVANVYEPLVFSLKSAMGIQDTE